MDNSQDTRSIPFDKIIDYHELFDNAAILLFTTDIEGNFISCNKHVRQLGFEPGEIVKMNIFDLVAPEYNDLVKAKIADKIQGVDITAYDIEIINRVNERIFLELNTRLIYDGERPIGIQGAARDITNQKKVQAALEASEQKFRILTENSKSIVYILKEDSFIYVNPALIQITGYSEGELLGMNFWDVVHPDSRIMAQETGLARLRGEDIPSSYELKLLSKNNEDRWVYLTGVRIIYDGEAAVMGSAIDITERKRSDEALREAKQLLDNIIDFLPDAFMAIDSQGKVLAWNRAMEKLTGVSAADIVGKGDYEYAIPFYGSRRPILIDLMLASEETVKESYAATSRFGYTITGEVFVPGFGDGGAYLWGIATLLYNSAGEIIGAIESIRDITKRKRMEEALISQTEYLTMLLEKSPTGIAIQDSKGNFTFLNNRITEMTGYIIEDIPTMEAWVEKAYPNARSRKILMDDWDYQMRLYQKANGVARVHCMDGSTKNIEFHAVRLPNDQVIFGLWDMTWQKQVEETLRMGEARFKALSDASFEGIILTENDICIEVNRKAAEMLGYDITELIGMNTVTLAVPDTYAAIKCRMGDEYDLPYEGFIVRKDGSTLPVEIQTRSFEYQGRNIRAEAYRDLSERLQTEAELTRQRQNLQALFINSLNAIALLNKDSVVMDINPQFTAMLGYSLEECRGKHLNDLIIPEGLAHEYTDIQSRVQRREPIQVETIRKSKDGRVLDVLAQAVPIPNYGAYVTYYDIGDRKKKEQIINDQLLELEAKNAEMERFTYTVSHDLRGPLITIKGFAGLLMDDIKQGEHKRLESDLTRIIRAADKMNELLSDLLELSRIGRLLNDFTSFSMTALAEEVVELLAGSIKEHQVEVVIQPDMPPVFADQARIREVIQNLVENSIKFRGERKKPLIEIGATKIEEEIVFFIRDNGVGIDTRYQDTIFGLFNKLDASAEGTGIGLSLVKRIIEFHQGRVWVQSAGVGHGSCFYFTLGHKSQVNTNKSGLEE
ncbi:MAG: PAS domain S-box protein [Deltaproteobacteria bacterium]